MTLLAILLVLFAAPFVVASLYLAILSALSSRGPESSGEVTRAFALKFDIVVPAHNEELGIRATVEDLLHLDYPRGQFRVLVVADNCSDRTAEEARAAGATVWERRSQTERGKGYALAYAFERSANEGLANAAVVIDADTRASRNLLRAYALRLEQGAHAVQAHYGVLNAGASWRTRLMAIALALFHRLRSSARERLGVSCGLRGNGMCFSHRLLKQVPHQAFSIVEDLEYGIRLGEAGHRVHFAGEADVLGEMVSGERASRSQRQRWEGGRWTIARRHGLPLLRKALSRRSGLLLDLALDVLVPPLSTLVLGIAAGLLAALLLGRAGGSFVPAWIWAGCAACVALYIVRGWWLSGVGYRGLMDLMFAPVYIAWKLSLALRGGARRKEEWVRTAREGETR